MNISKEAIADAISAPFDPLSNRSKENSVNLIERLNYLVEHLIYAQDLVEHNADEAGDEALYAIGDTLNLLMLIKEKI